MILVEFKEGELPKVTVVEKPQRPLKVTVQQRFVDPEFKEGAYMEIRLRAKRLGNLRPGDVVEVAPDKNGNLIIKKKGDEHGTATKQVSR